MYIKPCFYSVNTNLINPQPGKNFRCSQGMGQNSSELGIISSNTPHTSMASCPVIRWSYCCPYWKSNNHISEDSLFQSNQELLLRWSTSPHYDVNPTISFHDVANLPNFKSICCFFKRLLHLTPTKWPEIAAALGRAAINNTFSPNKLPRRQMGPQCLPSTCLPVTTRAETLESFCQPISPERYSDNHI